MKIIKRNKKLIASLLVSPVTTVMLSSSAYAEQIGIPETSIVVSQQSSATDAEDCGTASTPTCRTIQHAVNRIAQGGGIIVFSGTYVENILVDKADITISSIEGRNDTFIDGSSATNNTVSEAIRIIADGVSIGLSNSPSNGFTFHSSVASGLFSIGNNVIVSGNSAISNGARGFQFGLSNDDDSIDNASKNILDDPLNGATIVEGRVQLLTQSNVTVSENHAVDNALGGFYFSAFDDSSVRDCISTLNRGTPDLGEGSGFWIGSGSNRVILEDNYASSNSGDGIFYRRGGGTAPGGGIVTDQTAIGNYVNLNGRHGINFMGYNVIAQENIAISNRRDGFHFMGYDTILDISYNTAKENSGAGIGLENGFFMGRDVGNPFVYPLTFDADGSPIQNGGIHHNVISGNQAHSVPGLAGDFLNCGIATNLNNGTTIEISENSFGNDQEICDEFGVVIQIQR